MDNFNNPQVEKVIRNGYEFRFSDYISRGFDIAKKAVIPFASFFVMFLIINGVFEYFKLELGVAGIILTIAFSYVVSPCLMAGLYLAMREVDENQGVQFADFFKGFDWAKQIITLSVIQGIIALVIMIPFVLVGLASFEQIFSGDYTISAYGLENEMYLFALLFIPLIYLFVSWSFAPLLIIFHNMEAWPAMEASRKILTQKWFVFFAFLFVVGLIGALGVLGLIIGLLFTIPAGIAMIYAAFRDIVGMPEDGQDDLLDHLISIDKI